MPRQSTPGHRRDRRRHHRGPRRDPPGAARARFGVKTRGLRRYGPHLQTADPLAWSYDARRSPRLPDCTTHPATASTA
ncbi:DUF7221 family queuine tRNA-ribosyltransferase-like protein [Umezawaea beigongshangensis]|uniref:deazapurine DNA modification protein DpdA family protein n=1 Tax=Umezawaea beigongshangensis TaxID=2780383 RepID=UPI003F6882B6